MQVHIKYVTRMFFVVSLIFQNVLQTDVYFIILFTTRCQFTESKYNIINEVQKGSRLFSIDKMTEGNIQCYKQITFI